MYKTFMIHIIVCKLLIISSFLTSTVFCISLQYSQCTTLCKTNQNHKTNTVIINMTIMTKFGNYCNDKFFQIKHFEEFIFWLSFKLDIEHIPHVWSCAKCLYYIHCNNSQYTDSDPVGVSYQSLVVWP